MVKKKHSLSTGSVVAIVLGALILVFMILTFIDYQIKQNKPQEVILSCNEGLVLGADKLCHSKCGEKGYCEGKDVCYNEQCYSYPSKAISCMDKLEDDLDDYNSGANIINRLPEKTCYESLFKYNLTAKLVLDFAESSNDCLEEVENKDFLLEELGYDMVTYIGRWDNITSEVTYNLLEWKVRLEQECN